MAFYDNFIQRNKSPVESWREQTQEFLNEHFENSSDFLTIEKEVAFGTLEFEQVPARVTTTLDSKVGDKINDDYRTLFFPDITFKPVLGSRYQFFDNVWIVYSTDNVNSLNSSCYVRRCNNTINSLDEYGNVHQEPCVIDIKPTKSSFMDDDEMFIPTSRQVIMYQNNQWTKQLDINSRIIFNTQAYRMGTNLDFNRLKTYEKESVGLVTAYLDEDLVNEFDNMELQIADYHFPEFKIDVLTPSELVPFPSSEWGVSTYTSVYRDGKSILPELVWSAEEESAEFFDLTELNEGGSTLHYNSDMPFGTYSLKVALKANPNIYKICSYEFKPVATLEPVKFTVSGDLYVPLNQQKKYYLTTLNTLSYEYTIELLTPQNKYFEFSHDDYSFTVTNKKQWNEGTVDVKVTASSEGFETTSQVYCIQLGGLF